MLIWGAQENKELLIQLYLFLKWLYPSGKTKLSSIEFQAIAQMMGYTDSRHRQLKENIDKLKELEWIRYNSATKYYLLVSFDKLRQKYDWESRVSLPCSIEDISNIQAFVGAAIFTYLHKDFWRKVKREKSVRLKGRAYHFLSPSFNYLNSPAPIATTGVESLFNISKSKASILKQEAFKKGYIKVKKDFEVLPHSPSDIKLMIKYGDISPNIKHFNNKFHLQLIDLVLPNIYPKRRQKLGT